MADNPVQLSAKAPSAKPSQKPTVWLGGLLILLLPILPAAVSWRAHVPEIAALSQVGPGEVDLAQALTWDQEHMLLWVDSRSEAAFAKEHIPGAILLNEDRWDDLFLGLIARWAPGLEVVVYCDSRLCDASHHVAERLRADLQTSRVHVLHGGWQAWLEARGSSTESATPSP